MNKPQLPSEALLAVTEQYDVGRIGRHILLCADQTEPKCAPRDETLEAWNFLKRRLHELGLTVGERIVYRTKANCLRMCEQGPIAVVYPEGTLVPLGYAQRARADHPRTSDRRCAGGGARVRNEPADRTLSQEGRQSAPLHHFILRRGNCPASV